MDELKQPPGVNGKLQDSHVDLSFLAENWPSGIVARSKIGEFTGGMISRGTMANLDSQGLGPDGAIRIGRVAGYMVVPLIKWLEQRATRLRAKKPAVINANQRSAKHDRHDRRFTTV